MPVAAMLDALFASALARDATYLPAAGAALPVRLLLRRPDAAAALFETRAILPQLSAEVQVSEVVASAEGDRVEVDGGSYRVRTAERDPERLLWRLALEEA